MSPSFCSIRQLISLGIGTVGLVFWSGCQASEPVVANSDGLTMKVTCPAVDAEFSPGDEVQFCIEIYNNADEVNGGTGSGSASGSTGDDVLGDDRETTHAGHEGGYHVWLDSYSDEDAFVSEIPVFTIVLPDDITPGPHFFRIEYHADFEAQMNVEALLNFTVRN
ncbi:MAG: hypothetical protein HJJLKODD_00490 [Phycisphaerae bacterium]|nr:hypothetical protein [Phycisphaerae bacterium]